MARLPSGFQEVEYIESTGTQYINLGYSFNISTSFDFKIAFTATDSNQNILGTNVYGSIKDWLEVFRIMSGTFYSTLSEQKQLYTADTNIHKVFFNFGGMTIDNGSIYEFVSWKQYSSNVQLYLFCTNDDGIKVENAKCKLYYLKTYDKMNLIHEYIPCYRKSDLAIGLYDTVEEEFLTNDGTGVFLKGREVGILPPLPTSKLVFDEKVYGSVIYGGDDMINYSTQEQKTGQKWIDGKPIYQKTFINVNKTITSGTNWQVINSVDLTNVDTLISGDFYRETSGGISVVKLNNIAEMGISNDYKLQVAILSNSYLGTIQTITLQYTKTTD